MEIKELVAMKIGEAKLVSAWSKNSPAVYALRCPGGWVWSVQEDTALSTCFVPEPMVLKVEDV